MGKENMLIIVVAAVVGGAVGYAIGSGLFHIPGLFVTTPAYGLADETPVWQMGLSKEGWYNARMSVSTPVF